MMTLARPFLSLAFCSALTLACENDYQASVYLPAEPIAVGAYFPLNVYDACSGGGKVSVCATDNLVSVDSIDVDDPRIAEVFPMEQLTEGTRLSTAELVISARSAGKTTVHLDTTFDDDTHRAVSAPIHVATPDSMELVHSCPVRDPEDFDLFPVGTQVRLTVNLLAQGTKLRGEHQSAVLSGKGVEQSRGYLEENAYVWTVPSKSGTTTLSSPLFDSFTAKYRSYDHTTASIDSIEPKYDLTTPYQSYIPFSVAMTVSGKRPCALLPLQIESLTPDVCGGPDGLAAWTEDEPEYGLSVRALKSGTCSFTVTVDGSSKTVQVEEAIEVTDVPPVVVDPCEGVTCEAPALPCPEGTTLAKDQCCNACVPVPNPSQCEVERQNWDALYAEQLSQSTSCSVDADCFPVVLVQGCRTYCFVALNAQSTVTFMNAISETYHTKCPSCMVGGAADCPGSGQTYCNAGICAMRR